MRDRIGTPTGVITQYEPRVCDACGGAKGATETTTGANGAPIQVWRPCGACAGQGVR